MSAQPNLPGVAPAPEGYVNIEIDGVAMIAPKGSMIIQAADKAGIAIPRFCYHEKLPIAANCRMCLVDVEKSPKPAPACATPVMEGMKVYTRSKRALDSQRNVMELLLINHPLDCPVCDQGGECELQDLAMGYGRSVSRFTEGKRSVADEDLGPLVASDMTRCIHCTRCVRFTAEIAGTYDLGGLGRGDRTEIGTYIGKTIGSELSGNVIDACPVGALTNKPFRFRARPWELVARASLGYHDALGSNLWLHLRRGEVLRCVPRDNDAINENWLSDRDRYSHAGLAAADRLSVPMIRHGQQWREASWDEALARTAELLKASSGDDLGLLLHPSSSNEEGALLAALARGLDCGNLDHRIAQADLADAPVAQVFQMPLAEIENADVIVLVGCNPRHEAPLLNHRIRKAQRGKGAKVIALNPLDFDFNFELAQRHLLRPSLLPDALLALAQGAGATLPGGAGTGTDGLAPEAVQGIVTLLREARRGLIVLGEVAATHPQASWLRQAARALAAASGAACNEIPLGANAIGLAQQGVLPRARDAAAMLAQPRKAYLLYGIEPEHDFADTPAALRALSQADSVVAFCAYADETLKRVAQVLLPIGLAPEIDASFTNVDGCLQRTAAAARLPGQVRAGWRVLRALGAQLGLPGFDFVEWEQLHARLQTQTPGAGHGLAQRTPAMPTDAAAGLELIATRAIYGVDAVVRRAAPLQAHPLMRGACIGLNPADAEALGLAAGAMAKVDDGRGCATLPVELNARVPQAAAWIEKGYAATAPLAGSGARIKVTRA